MRILHSGHGDVRQGLLDQNPDPSRVEAAATIRNNICRCTGYQKIIEAILLSARCFGKIFGQREQRRGLCRGTDPACGCKGEVLGTGQYPDDVYLDDMIYASAVRSEYPRAKVLAIHTEKVLELEGVIGVYTADDIPGSVKVGHLKPDWDQ